MKICDNCWTPSTNTENAARVVEVHELVPDNEPRVTLATELCTPCRTLLVAQDWSGLAAAKRKSTVRRKPKDAE